MPPMFLFKSAYSAFYVFPRMSGILSNAEKICSYSIFAFYCIFSNSGCPDMILVTDFATKSMPKNP